MTQPSQTYPKRAMILLDGWAGVWNQQVEVVGATAKRYRCRAISRTQIAGRNRWVEPGETFLVPMHAVRFDKGDGIRSMAAVMQAAKYIG